MRTEADIECVKKLGFSLHVKIKIVCRNISRKLLSQGDVQLPYTSPTGNTEVQLICNNLTHIGNKRSFIATGFICLNNSEIWEWKVERNDLVTNLTSFKKRTTHLNLSNNTKICTCTWSFLHSNEGCKCGAITPYQPKNFYK